MSTQTVTFEHTYRATALHYAMIAETPEMVAAMKQLDQPPVVETRGR